MYVTNVTNDYDNIKSSNYTVYDKMTLINCTNNENIKGIIIALFTIMPCGLSLMCFISLLVYTFFKPLFSRK